MIHDNLDLEVRHGEVLGVVGGSGTGKSVLLRTIIGLNRPRAGTIVVLGQDTSQLSDAEWVELAGTLGCTVSERRACSAL